MTKPLNIAFLWHLHQPYYKSASGIYQMPWVRFHTTKDYLDLMLIAKRFPGIRQTFNIVPSLAKQLLDYAQNEAREVIWELSEIPADTLNTSQKEQILHNFFLLNEIQLKYQHPHYQALQRKCRDLPPEASLARRLAVFSIQDWRDLQIWYNLAWIGPVCRERPRIKRLLEKGEQFSEADKTILFEEVGQILEATIPLIRKLWDAGQIELVTSPFYHPILPLLIDSNIANVCAPDIVLPQPPFQHPEDAREQVRRGLDYIRRHFGRKPVGMLPPEGALSKETLKIIAKHKVRWVVSDETIFTNSTYANRPPHHLYQAHQLDIGSRRNIHIFFRDRQLSDAISLSYGNLEPQAAVDDFVQRLYNIRSEISMVVGEDKLKNYLVTIICDGENCWDFYPDSGRAFLGQLFKKICEDPLLRSWTFSEFLEEQPETPLLENLHPGSRMHADFNIWIADDEDRKAWNLLKQTRDFLVDRESKGVLSDKTLKEAWESIYIAEGSDWCWWYGDEHVSMQDMAFDRLFREHLMKVYELAGKEPPAVLFQTIKRAHFDRFAAIRALRPISPDIDGEVVDEREWSGAAIFEVNQAQNVERPLDERLIKKLYLGYNDRNIFFRIDFFRQPDMFHEFVINVKIPRNIQLIISPLRGVVDKVEPRTLMTNREVLPPSFKLRGVLEAAFSKTDLGIVDENILGFQVQVRQFGQVREVYPQNQVFEIELPQVV